MGCQSRGRIRGEERRLPAGGWAHQDTVCRFVSDGLRDGLPELPRAPFHGPPSEIRRGLSQPAHTWQSWSYVGRTGWDEPRTPASTSSCDQHFLNPKSQASTEVAQHRPSCGHMSEPTMPTSPDHTAQQGLQHRSEGSRPHKQGSLRHQEPPELKKQGINITGNAPEQHATPQNLVPSQRGSMGCVSTYEPGVRVWSQSGHMPSLQLDPSVGRAGGRQLTLLTIGVSLSALPLPLRSQ